MAFAKANAFFFFFFLGGRRFGFFFFPGGSSKMRIFFFSEGGEGQRRRPAIGQLFSQGGAQVRRGKSVVLPLLIGFWKGSTNRIFFLKG